MAQPTSRSFPALPLLWLLVGAAMLAVGLWVGITRFQPLLNGHPLTLSVAFGCVLVGVVALGLGILVLINRRSSARGAASARGRSARAGRVAGLVLSVLALIICLVATVLLGWSRPFAATDRALQGMRTTDTVRLTERLTSYDLVPTRRTSEQQPVEVTTGLIFYPGARVDARAYAAQLRPLAEAGYLVVVLKEPFGLALFDADQAGGVLDVHPGIAHWAVGGHSLGGVAASSFADRDRRVSGLVLYASQPAGRLSRTDLKVLSVYGTRDGLQTPAKTEASKALLPASTRYVPLQGGVHAFFGDYGEQPGDGTPTVPRATAQTATAKATIALLASLTPPKPKK